MCGSHCSLIATFYAFSVNKNEREIEAGPDVVHVLREKLRENRGVLDFPVLQIDTLSERTHTHARTDGG